MRNRQHICTSKLAVSSNAAQQAASRHNHRAISTWGHEQNTYFLFISMVGYATFVTL